MRSIVWFNFSDNSFDWQISNIRFNCGTTPVVVPGLTPPVQPAPTSVSVPAPIPVSTPPSVQSIPRPFVPPSSQSGANLLVEDFTSQSRLTFLFYNALLKPSSDDGTMDGVIVGAAGPNRLTLTPKDSTSYWFTQLSCMNVASYSGISLRIDAPPGTSFIMELGYQRNCGDVNDVNIDVTTNSLGWKFDGTERLYALSWTQFPGLDVSKLNTILIYGLSSQITLGPISLFKGNRPIEYVVPPAAPIPTNAATVPAPAGNAPSMVIDTFQTEDSNDLGLFRAVDEGIELAWEPNGLEIISADPDYTMFTKISSTCLDFRQYDEDYLHVAYGGSTSFSIALQQHNSQCNEKLQPYPETWDEVEATRYAKDGHIYIPISHFNIDKSRVIGFAFKSWFSTEPTTFKVVEVVKSVPAGWQMPSKLPTGRLIFACKRPNSFAFCIDDGDPKLAQQVMRIVKEENIKVTFFTVGAPLLDPSTNLTNVYREMASQGHQIALHSYTHPKIEGLSDYNAIDWEINNDVSVVAQMFNGLHTPYFRPPFGTEGARLRYRWVAASGREDANIVNWSVDVEDWLWAMSSTPQNQLDAFKRDVDKGGNLVVMHYLYNSTVSYLREFIQYAKKSGKQLMRLDQCMMDPR
jgi:peptidoglycan/xylan/chitin deacetylase (PgdA/CDA1 family)